MKRRLAVLCLLALVGCVRVHDGLCEKGRGSAACTPPSPTGSDSSVAGSPGESLDDLAAAVRAYGEGEAIAEFGGLWIGGGALNVAFTDHLDQHQARLRQLIGDRSLRLVKVRYSLSYLREIQARIDRDRVYLKQHGIEPSAWGPEEDKNQVFLMIKRKTPQAVRLLEDRYGKDALDISEGTVRPVNESSGSP